ncbi:hypothetical protein [Micromonospora sp. NPDC050695]|uniref:hypothetical protein n=1 Tax=Micromonospora sp. NPDC050695 TaxID=3154938 RepID=UPI0033D31C6D
MNRQRQSFGRALLHALADPYGYLTGGTTTTTNTYLDLDAPQMPATSKAGTVTFTPEQIEVTYHGARFRQMEISGPANGHEQFNIIRRFDRERDVPEWARKYLGEDMT